MGTPDFKTVEERSAYALGYSDGMDTQHPGGREYWRDIAERLALPFDASEVNWRPQGKTEPNKKCQLVAYVDARTVQDRLDAVVGIGGWSFDWTPVNSDPKSGELLTAKGTLTIGGVSKSDIGTASQWEADKGAVSDALKRAAVHWGIGRHLYTLPYTAVTLDDNGHIPAGTIDRYRQRYTEKFGTPAKPVEAPKENAQPAPAQQTSTMVSKEAAPRQMPARSERITTTNGIPNKPATLTMSSVRLFARHCGFETQAQYDQLVVQATRRMLRSNKDEFTQDELKKIADKAVEYLEYAAQAN